jgi:ABC-type molybdate transport system permease subunit
MMLGGNIPGETTVLSTEIYRLVEGWSGARPIACRCCCWPSRSW